MDFIILLKGIMFYFLVFFAFILLILSIVTFCKKIIPNYISKIKFKKRDCDICEGTITNINKRTVRTQGDIDNPRITTDLYYAMISYTVESNRYVKTIYPDISQSDRGPLSKIINSSKKRADTLVGKNVKIFVDKETEDIFSPEIYKVALKNSIVDMVEAAIRMSLTVALCIFVTVIICEIFGW